ncbi:ankyrin repeat domain-containing protein 63 [Tupaia chinensis]|uniref:Ankyrin repeat domain-containing protein 63 n=1 Tax=Tupaia chinensis TaxID=246437 RepID=L9JGK8_TUPCH|nr:ankyrin repeat domain-containing protein 63 [Tupaia chinensis]ELW48172.1 Ankyrin repeat domain-containing protein 63 [Tupaia chinensis]
MLKPKDLCPRAGTRTFLEAMQAGKVHLARFVLDALDRSIIDCRAEQGRTPLMVAVGLPDPALRARFVRLLLEQGAAVNLRDERGRTALSLACERGHLDAVQLLGEGHGGEAGSAGKGSGRHRAQGNERPELGRSMSLALGAVTEEEAVRLRAGALMARPNSPQSSGTGRWRSQEVLEGAPPSLVQAPIGLSPHPEGGPGSGRLGLRRRSTAPDIPSLVGEGPGSESGPESEANALPLSVPEPKSWQTGTEAVVLHAQR